MKVFGLKYLNISIQKSIMNNLTQQNFPELTRNLIIYRKSIFSMKYGLQRKSLDSVNEYKFINDKMQTQSTLQFYKLKITRT